MKKQFLLALVVSVMAVSNVNAQQSKSFHSSYYNTAIGIKFYPGALSVKHFLGESAALEGLAYFHRGLRITGLYEIHYKIGNVEGLNWYIGPGAHIGFFDNQYGGGVSVGVDGVLGLDYKFIQAPINLSLDWQPSFEFAGEGDYNGFHSWGGFAIRYTL